MRLDLPYPPTINHYYVNTRTGSRVGPNGKVYQQAVWLSCRKQGIKKPLKERLSVAIECYVPDKRKRDLDNVLKALLDALEGAGVYENDSQIDGLAIFRAGVEKPGKVIVHIEPFSAAFDLGVYS